MQRVTALGRGLAVLAAFDPEHPALTLTEIAAAAGQPLSTTHRIVAELTRWGALERSADGTYAVGLRLYQVGALAPRGVGLRDAALPVMEDLYELTHEVVQLAVREGTELVYIERLAGRTSVQVRTKVGLRFPLPPSGAGLVLLAHAPDEVREEVLAAPQARFTDRTVTDPARLRRMLAAVRRDGAAVSVGQVTDDVLSVAAPVRDGAGEVVAALAVVVPVATPSGPLVPLLVTAARAISRAL